MKRTKRTEEFDSSGRLGFKRTSLTLEIPVQDRVRHPLHQSITLWKRGDDGIWRVYVDISNRDAPLDIGQFTYGVDQAKPAQQLNVLVRHLSPVAQPLDPPAPAMQQHRLGSCPRTLWLPQTTIRPTGRPSRAGTGSYLLPRPGHLGRHRRWGNRQAARAPVLERRRRLGPGTGVRPTLKLTRRRPS